MLSHERLASLNFEYHLSSPTLLFLPPSLVSYTTFALFCLCHLPCRCPLQRVLFLSSRSAQRACALMYASAVGCALCEAIAEQQGAQAQASWRSAGDGMRFSALLGVCLVRGPHAHSPPHSQSQPHTARTGHLDGRGSRTALLPCWMSDSTAAFLVGIIGHLNCRGSWTPPSAFEEQWPEYAEAVEVTSCSLEVVFELAPERREREVLDVVGSLHTHTRPGRCGG